MIRNVHKQAAVALLTAVGLAGFAALAGAHAVAISAPGFRYVSVGADAAGGIGPCSDFAVAGGGVLARVCFRSGNAGANVGYGSARAGAADGDIFRRTFIKGLATAGPGVAAVGDTTVIDSMDIVMTPVNATQVQVVMNGLLRVQSPSNRSTGTSSNLRVYPDAATAQADVDGNGAGAVFVGTIRVESRPGLVPTASFAGGFTSGNFVIDQSAGNTLNIRANNVTKIVNVPSSATAAVGSSSHTEGAVNVPGQSPVSIALLGFALAGVGLVVLRKKRARIAA